MQFNMITIAILSLVQSAAIQSSTTESLASISDQEQVPEWLIEFNEYLNNDVLDFDWDDFMENMSDDQIDDFFDVLDVMLTEEQKLLDEKIGENIADTFQA